MRFIKFVQPLIFAAAALSLAPATWADSERHDRDADVVYTMSNAPDGNRVLAFRTKHDGTLEPAGAFRTGGLGTGAGLGNQGALATDGDFLLVVNPGSDDISVFWEFRGRLKLVDRIASGGIQPVSVTIDRDLVYVLNAGSDSIAGFVLHWSGRLRTLPGSEQGLSDTGVGAAQIQFSRDGRTLIVTEKNSNKIVTFALNRAGLPVGREITDSPGQTPFGFALARGSQVLISEAAGGAPNASSISSFRLSRGGELKVLDPAVPTTESAACWVAVTPNSRFAYTTNTGSGTLSGFRILAEGQLQLLNDDGVTATTGAGSAPIDMTFSDRGELLHVLGSGNGTITSFAVSPRGALRKLGSVGGLPAGTNGLVAF